jgi:hypothetical protein
VTVISLVVLFACLPNVPGSSLRAGLSSAVLGDIPGPHARGPARRYRPPSPVPAPAGGERAIRPNRRRCLIRLSLPEEFNGSRNVSKKGPALYHLSLFLADSTNSSGLTFIQTVGIFVCIPGAVLVGITVMVYGGRWRELWQQRKAGVRPQESLVLKEPVLGRPAGTPDGEGPITHAPRPVSTPKKASGE